MDFPTNINSFPKFKFNSLTPLPKNVPSNPDVTPKNQPISLPFLSKRQKIKTCPSQTHPQSSVTFNTPTNHESPSQKSASSRQLSRLIYHYLQKKIILQQKAFRNINNNVTSRMEGIDQSIDSQQQYVSINKNKKFNRHVYAYEKELKNNPHYTQHLQYRNRLNFPNNTLIKNGSAKPEVVQNLACLNKAKSPLTCIDAYFDLSCLQTCNSIKKPAVNPNL